jgi:hypothetical protein
MTDNKALNERSAVPPGDELRPCPFCGSAAEMDTRQSYRNISTGNLEDACAIYCTSCSAHVSHCYADLRDMARDDVIELARSEWNARPAPPSEPPPPRPKAGRRVMRMSDEDRARIVEAMARAMWLGPRPDLISGTALAILQRDAAAALDAALSAGLADAIRGTAEARVKELEDFVGWIDTWVSNPAGSYSLHALDGLFAATRERTAALPTAQQEK